MANIRVFTAFSGYDSQCMALERLGIDYELVGWSEIDKYAIQAHDAVFPKWMGRNYGDISKIDWDNVPDFDLLTYSSPCQDFSSAGLQRGAEEGSGTRSSLLWECRKAILAKKPKYLVFENVKAVVSKKFKPLFDKWCSELEGYGYTNNWKIINAKECGIPQNRPRIIMVSELNGGGYEFPKPIELKKRIADIIEGKVDARYYLKDQQVKGIIEHCERKKAEGCGFSPNFKAENEISTAIPTGYGNKQTDTYFVELLNSDCDGNAKCIKANYYKMGFTNFTRKMFENKKDGYVASGVLEYTNDYFKIRKFTPTECFRLMGVSDKDIHSIKMSGLSNTQMYKMAGNSIVVDVLEKVFENIFFKKEEQNPIVLPDEEPNIFKPNEDGTYNI